MRRRDSQEVHVALAGRLLRVEAAAGSKIFDPLHRIFFTNVLAFDLDDDTPAYTLTGDGSPLTAVLEAVRYLDEAGFEVVLNDVAADVTAAARADESEFSAARDAGAQLKRHPERTVVVPGLKRALKPYQIPAVVHLARVVHAANFSVPGSGKTAIALAAFAILRAARVVKKLVVVGPRSAFMPWEEEVAASFSRKLRSVRIVGPKTKRMRLYRVADKAELVLLTYQMASNDAQALSGFLRRHEVMLVLDESHNIKRLEGGKWAETLIGLAPLAAKRVILSGTPVPNSILDLWSQVEFLWPQNSPLGARGDFKYRADTRDEATIKEAREAVSPFYWRIKKEDLGLPRPKYYRIPVPMSKYQRAIYNVIAAKVLGELVKAPEERIKLRMWRRARMVRLLQAASNPALLAQDSTEFRIPPIDASGLPVDRVIEKYTELEMPEKLRIIDALVRKLVARGRQVLIWTSFVHNLLTLERQLADLKPGTVYGAIPRDEEEIGRASCRERV